MNLARDGITAVAIAALVAVVMYAAALNRRSWALWLLAFALTIVALWIAYVYREPGRSGPGVERAAVAPAEPKAAHVIVTYRQEGEQVHYGQRMELR